MLSQTEENYLKTLYLLANEEDVVNLSEISKRLEISSPTANSMIKNLHEKGLVKYEKYKPILLTQKGKLSAAYIIRKHRLTEMYLVEKMEFGWEDVHEIAEQMEHIIAPRFFDKMDELLGFPEVDPHGSPIPNKDGKVIQQHHQQLSQCAAGETVILSSLKQSENDFLNFLNSRGLALGTLITIVSIEPFDQSMVVNYNDQKSVSLSQTVCEQLLVTKK
jgi:DtxR family Mn-dependent transcriptional regulator